MSRPRPIPPASKPDEAALKPGDVEVMPVPGLPLAGQKAATVLGLKLTGQWSRRSAPTLAGQWQVTTEGWSVRAEAWAHDRDTASWREVAEARRLRRDLALYPHQARQTGKETNR